MKEYLQKHKIKILFLALGAIGGYLYWHYIGCTSGSCPITSKWYSSAAYGMLLGWLISDFFSKKQSVKTENSNE